MAVMDPRTWLEHLTPAQCWQLLASTPVGRIGVLRDSAPEIYPLNHVVDHESVVFRTEPGGKLDGLLRSPSVCYQVDAIDPANASGWSVLVKGRATEVRDRHELERLAELELRWWVPGPKQHWVRIVPHEVTGRRIWTPPADEGGKATGPAQG